MFKKVDSKQDFIELEKEVLSSWEKEKTFKKLQEKNKGGKKWSFIDGPITANNPMGVHHAWGRTYKDLFQRYKAMEGCDERWQNGFDCQGLWVEVEVEKDLGFNSKQDILEFGLDNFSKACRERVEKYSKVQTAQSKRLGQWMDWENSYFTFSEENNEHIWYFLKKCYEKDWLFKGTNSMPWCTRCGTALSQHELSDGGYKTVKHKSVYTKFPVKGKKSEYFLVWTTTPWTLLANTSLAVNEEMDYVKVKQGDEKYILAESLVDILEKNKGEYEVIEKMKGKDLVGIEYEGLFSELEAQKGLDLKVVGWDYVSAEDGTGIVHVAPGCGQEDFELGQELNLGVLVPIDGFGIYQKEYGDFSGKDALKVRDDVFNNLKEKNLLYKIQEVEHRYPHCWRCKTECVFRVVDEWFIKIDEVRPRMKEAAKMVNWVPESSGKRMQNWLDNMGDWVISRKRFWGLALPFYECDCGELVVVGTREELRELAVDPKKVDELPELHRPWIDEVKIKCPKCQKEISRIEDVGDCWLDAGIVPFSTLHYLSDKDYWKEWFPAEFICEMRAQIRLWFYSLLFMSVVLEDKPSYKVVKTYETVGDEKGDAMHKSTGNAIWFDDAVEKMGADVMRWMYLRNNPTETMRFGYNIAKDMRKKLMTLWNTYSFFVTYANIDEWGPEKIDGSESKNELDRWIISELNQLILDVRKDLDNWGTANGVKAIEEFIDSLSNWYVRRSRRRFWKSENDNDKNKAYETLWNVLQALVRLMAPLTPFFTEEIFRNLTGKESVHLADYPEVDRKKIDEELNERMSKIRRVVKLGHGLRDKSKIRARQPLSEVLVWGVDLNKEDLEVLKNELNVCEVKTVSQAEMKKLGKEVVKLNFQKAGPRLGSEVKNVSNLIGQGKWKIEEESLKVGEVVLTVGEYIREWESSEKGWEISADRGVVVALKIEVTQDLLEEGWARDLVRMIQELRKEAKYEVSDRIKLFIGGEGKVYEGISKNIDYIKKETLVSDDLNKEEPDLEKEVSVGGENLTVKIKR